MSSPTLVTIPPSHYCDKARWALDRAGLAYREEGHVPIVHYAFVYPRTRTRTVPVLLRDGERPLVDSNEILRWADSTLPEPRRLFPEDPALARAVEGWVERFDQRLGPAVRRHIYCFIALHPRTFVEIFTPGLGALERTFLALGQAGLRAMLRKAFRVSPRAAERTRAEIHALFAEVDAQLADGRRYLLGDRFTAADLTFAALAGPLLSPPAVRTEMPSGLAETVRLLGATTAAAFGLRLLAERP
jgi:glutathione S-transferase